MAYMEQIAKMLNVEIGEEFKIEGYDDNLKFRFEENRFSQSYSDWWVNSCSIMSVLEGKAKLIKIPKPILNEEEEKYLSAVIKPFRKEVESITKYDCGENEFICIDLENDSIILPRFAKGKMYKNMEFDKEYALEELGL